MIGLAMLLAAAQPAAPPVRIAAARPARESRAVAGERLRALSKAVRELPEEAPAPAARLARSGPSGL